MKVNMFRRFNSVALIVVMVTCFAVAPVCGYGDSRGEGVYLYEHDNFNGRVSAFYGDIDVYYIGNYSIGNDTVSSIKIIGPYEVTVYEHANYSGVSHTYRFSDDRLASEPIGNDRVSSLKIRRLSQGQLEGVYIFEHANYHGKWIRLTHDLSNIIPTYVGNDRASSVKIVGPYWCLLFQHINYMGSCAYVTGDIPHIGNTSVGNDQLSSVKVFRR